jgi:hypothetical protein
MDLNLLGFENVEGLILSHHKLSMLVVKLHMFVVSSSMLTSDHLTSTSIAIPSLFCKLCSHLIFTFCEMTLHLKTLYILLHHCLISSSFCCYESLSTYFYKELLLL